MNDESKENLQQKFIQRIRRGREFEQWERAQWKGDLNEQAQFEKQTEWQGKRGRIDIQLVDSQEGHTIVVEIKATDWDAMKPYRVRPNVMRHARQLWRYIEATLQDQSALPAIIYPQSPRTVGRREEVETLLNEQLIQVVWRDD